MLITEYMVMVSLILGEIRTDDKGDPSNFLVIPKAYSEWAKKPRLDLHDGRSGTIVSAQNDLRLGKGS